MFWFKKKKDEPIKYFIPEKEIIELLEMVDRDNELKSYRSRYAIWKRIEKIFPELDIKLKQWRLFAKKHVLTPYIIEIKED